MRAQRPEPCPTWNAPAWPDGHDDECPECGATVAWEAEAWERVTVAAQVFVARTLELWPDQGRDDLDPANELVLCVRLPAPAPRGMAE